MTKIMKFSELSRAKANPRHYPKIGAKKLLKILRPDLFEKMAWKEKVLYLCTYIDYLENFESSSPAYEVGKLFGRYRSELCREAQLLTGMKFEGAFRPLIASANEGTAGAVKLHDLWESVSLFPERYFLMKAIKDSPSPDGADLRPNFIMDLADELSLGMRHLHFEELLRWVDYSPTLELALLGWWEKRLKEVPSLTVLSLRFIALEHVFQRSSGRELEFLNTGQILLLRRDRQVVHDLLRQEDDFDTFARESPILAALILYEADEHRREVTGDIY